MSRRSRDRTGTAAIPMVAKAAAPRDSAELAREVCLRQLAVRPRTRAELATALRRVGIDLSVAAEVLDRYGEVGLVDDQAFARAWVTSRHHGQGLARSALASELRRKGVNAATLGVALGELDPSTEEATARALVDRRLGSERSTAPEAVFRRLVGLLARKGYPAGLAIRVVKDALTELARTAEVADLADFVDAIDPDVLADTVEIRDGGDGR